MNYWLIVSVGALCLLSGFGGWLGWQLLRQNGRILMRLDELEQRFDELEFDEADEPNEQPDELQGRARHSARAEARHQNDGAQGTDAPYPDDRASRFSNRSLARSRIKRDGLKAGTSAPSFRLPRLDGGELSLEEFRGKRVLLVFSDPHCGPCNALAPELEEFHRRQTDRDRSSVVAGRQGSPGELDDTQTVGSAAAGDRPRSSPITLVMISRGEPKENRAKVKEHGLSFPVVLQQRWEISRRYAMFATPVAYLIDETGIIAGDVAVGVEAILELMKRANDLQRERGAKVLSLKS